MVGRCIPYRNSPFLGDMLVFVGVDYQICADHYPVILPHVYYVNMEKSTSFLYHKPEVISQKIHSFSPTTQFEMSQMLHIWNIDQLLACFSGEHIPYHSAHMDDFGFVSFETKTPSKCIQQNHGKKDATSIPIPFPIGPMGLVYLPTFGINLW